LTLQEYLLDYSSPATREVGERLIAEELAKLPEGDVKQSLVRRLEEIKQGSKRDQYF